MELTINWPEGATHFCQAFGRYPTRAYAVVDGQWSYWTGFDWHHLRYPPVESIQRNLVSRVAQDFDRKCERVTMRLLGREVDPSPGVDWSCSRRWTVNEVRALVRRALEPEQ